MAIQNLRPNRQLTVAFITLIIVGVLFAYYFLVHTKTQESRIINQSFNSLNTLSRGFQDNLESHRTAIENLLKGNSELLFATYDSLQAAYEKKYRNESDFLRSRISIKSKKFDYRRQYYSHLSSKRREIEKKVLEELGNVIPETDAYKLVDIQHGKTSDKNKVSSQVGVNVRDGKITFYSTIISNLDAEKPPLNLRFSTNLEAFIAATFNNRIFDEFILISKDSMVYQTMDYKFKRFNYDTLKRLNREINYLNNIVQKFVKSGSSSDVVTDESLVSRALSSSNLYDINISATDYKLFLNQFEVNGTYWVLGGFMSSDFFNQQKRSVEPTILLIAISALLFILLASQLIKLFVLSEFEQFFIRNIIISVISITVGSSMLIIGLTSTISYWLEDRNKKDLELEILNDNIKESFFDELSEVINFVQTCDGTLSRNNWLSPPARLARQDFMDSFNINNPVIERFDNTYWISKQGNEMIQVYEATKPVSYLNLERREYFRSIRDGGGYVHSEFFSGSPTRFYFQALKSWVTGKKTVVVSVESLGAKFGLDSIPIVAAIATQFRSLQDCLLPHGYGFALIDESGTVLFHDDDRLSLSENFLQECSETNEIKSAMLSRTVSVNSVNYHNKKFRIYMSPLKNMPLYLITYHDREIFRLPGVLIFYYTNLFSLIGLISVGFWVVFLAVFNYQGSKLKFKSVILDWAIPNKNKVSWYWKATLVNTTAIIIICIFDIFFSKSPTNKFLLLFLASNFIFPVNYFMLRKCSEMDLKDLRLGTILKSIFNDLVIRVFFGLLIIFNSFLIYIDYAFIINLLFYQLSLLMLLFVPFILHLFKFRSALFQKLLTIKLARAYTAFTISWLILVSVIPAIFYFDITHQNELNIWKKFNQLQLVKEMHDREYHKKSKKKINRGIYMVLDKMDTIEEESAQSRKSLLINSIFYHLRLPISSLTDLTKSFVSGMQEKTEEWNWSIKKDPDPRLLSAHYEYLGNKADILFHSPPNLSTIDEYRSKYPDTSRRIVASRLILLLVILVVLILIYKMLYYLLNKIFGFEFLVSDKLVSSSRQQILTSVLNGNSVFIVGLPAPDFNELKNNVDRIKDLAKESRNNSSQSEGSKFNVLRLDLQDRHISNSDDLDLINKDLVVIDHFEYACNDVNKLRLNLSLIEGIKNQGKQIVIFSSISPRQVERIYNKFGKTTIIQGPAERASYMNDADLWSKLLKSFHVLHYKLAKHDMSHFTAGDKQNILETQLSELIREELSVSTYFKKVEPLVRQKYDMIVEQWNGRKISPNELGTLKEEMILYIQDIAQSYYFSLWNTCYKKQRFLLYDLAFDNIANFKDGATVLFLMKKGILKFDNGIHIMNNSFRHFVIDAISKEDALAMRREMEQKGTWSSTKMVLFIVGISLLVFIFMVNKGSINQVSAIITGVVALLGALLRIFSFGSGSAASGNN